MIDIKIIQATTKDNVIVGQLIDSLLYELDPTADSNVSVEQLAKTTKNLLIKNKIWIYLAYVESEVVGLITIHECAAIYAGGIFGEISELYVKPHYRSVNEGKFLMIEAIDKAKSMRWNRLEVGSPPLLAMPKTIAFYENIGFEQTGIRLRKLLNE